MTELERWRAFSRGKYIASIPGVSPRDQEVDIYRLEGTLRQHVENKRVFVFERLDENFQNIGIEDDVGYKYELFLVYADRSAYLLTVDESELWGMRDIPNWVQSQGSVHLFFSPIAPPPTIGNDPEYHTMVAETMIFKFIISMSVALYEQHTGPFHKDVFGVTANKILCYVNHEDQVVRTFVGENNRILATVRDIDGREQPAILTNVQVSTARVYIPFYIKPVVNPTGPVIVNPDIPLYRNSIVSVNPKFTVSDAVLFQASGKIDRISFPMPTDGEQLLEPLSFSETFNSGIYFEVRIPTDISDKIEYVYASQNEKYYMKLENNPVKVISEEVFNVIDFSISHLLENVEFDAPFIKVHNIWIRPWLTHKIQFDSINRVLIDGMAAVPKQ